MLRLAHCGENPVSGLLGVIYIWWIGTQVTMVAMWLCVYKAKKENRCVALGLITYGNTPTIL